LIGAAGSSGPSGRGKIGEDVRLIREVDPVDRAGIELRLGAALLAVDIEAADRL
jgi:hypothetical protein